MAKIVFLNKAKVAAPATGELGNRKRGFEREEKPLIVALNRNKNRGLSKAMKAFAELRVIRKDKFPIIADIEADVNNGKRKTQEDFNQWFAFDIARIRQEQKELEERENAFTPDTQLTIDKINTDIIFGADFKEWDSEFEEFPKLYCRVSGMQLAVVTPLAVKTALIYYPWLDKATIEDLFANCGNIHPAFYFTHAKAWHIMRKLDDISAITAIYGMNFKSDMRIAPCYALRAFFTELKSKLNIVEFNVLIDLLTDLQKINYKWLSVFHDNKAVIEQVRACAINKEIFENEESLKIWLNNFKHLMTLIVRLTIKHKIKLSNGVNPADKLHIENCLDKYGAKNLRGLKPLEGDASILRRVIATYFREFTIYTHELSDAALCDLVKNVKAFEAKVELSYLDNRKMQPPESFVKLKLNQELGNDFENFMNS